VTAWKRFWALRARWFLLAAPALGAAAVGVGLEIPDHCADDNIGFRCTGFGTVLMVLFYGCIFLAVLSVSFVAIRWVVKRRRRSNTLGRRMAQNDPEY